MLHVRLNTFSPPAIQIPREEDDFEMMLILLRFYNIDRADIMANTNARHTSFAGHYCLIIYARRYVRRVLNFALNFASYAC